MDQGPFLDHLHHPAGTAQPRDAGPDCRGPFLRLSGQDRLGRGAQRLSAVHVRPSGRTPPYPAGRGDGPQDLLHDAGPDRHLVRDGLAGVQLRAAAHRPVHRYGLRSRRGDGLFLRALPGPRAAGRGDAHPRAFGPAGHRLRHRLRGGRSAPDLHRPLQAHRIRPLHGLRLPCSGPQSLRGVRLRQCARPGREDEERFHLYHHGRLRHVLQQDQCVLPQELRRRRCRGRLQRGLGDRGRPVRAGLQRAARQGHLPLAGPLLGAGQGRVPSAGGVAHIRPPRSGRPPCR